MYLLVYIKGKIQVKLHFKNPTRYNYKTFEATSLSPK